MVSSMCDMELVSQQQTLGRHSECNPTLMVSSCTVRRRESTSSRISSSFFIRICDMTHVRVRRHQAMPRFESMHVVCRTAADTLPLR